MQRVVLNDVDPASLEDAVGAARYAMGVQYLRQWAGDARPAQARGQLAEGPSLKLLARLVQPGKNGGWVGGSLSWAKLDSLHYYGGHPTAQVRWLREIYAVYRSCSRSGYYSYGYSYGDEKSIDLSAFESRQLWPMLDEAESIGLRLVYGRKLGLLEKYCSAELCLDVIRSEPSGALVITSLIRVDGMDTGAAPVRFIGTEGHGLIYVDPAEAQRSGDHGSWRFRLARLTRAV